MPNEMMAEPDEATEETKTDGGVETGDNDAQENDN